MEFSSVLKHFPAPKFLKPSCVGLAISDFSLKMAKFGGLSPNLAIDTLLLPLEEGVVSAGSVRKPEILKQKIAEAREKFATDFTIFTVPDEFVYVYNAQIPFAKPQDLTEAVASTLEENVPMSLQDTLFDFVPTSITGTAGQYLAEVVVMVGVRNEIETLFSVLNEAGLEPLACLPESQAVVEAVVPRSFPGYVCIIHARDNRIAIYLAKNRVVHFVTIRNLSGGSYEEEFSDEFNKFIEYVSKYDGAEEALGAGTFVCGEFDYVKRVVNALSQTSKNYKPILANIWTNVFDVSRNVPDLPYEVSLSFGGAVGCAIAKI